MNLNPTRPGEADDEQLANLMPAPVLRDLPEDRRTVLRGYVMNEIHASHASEAVSGSRPSRAVGGQRSRRLALAAAFAAVVAGAVTTGPALLNGDGDRPSDVFAFGSGAVSPRLQEAIDICRERVSQVAGPGAELRLVNRGEAGDYAVAVFLTATRMLVCDAGPNSVGGHYGPYKQAAWLPGPISVEGTSTGNGDILVAGRVSDRVSRVELDHGDGTVTIARLSEGTFAVATDNAGIPAGEASLVTYDKAGKIIDRRAPEFLANTLTTTDGKYAETCWTDPAGTAVYGTPAPDCKPAEAWN